MKETDLIWIRETFTNTTKNCIFSETEIYETRYTWAEVGALYRSCVSEYGRCTSKVYVTLKDEDGVPVGWVFQKRMEYEDARSGWAREERFYLREVWVQLYAGQAVTSERTRPVRMDRIVEVG